MADTVAQLTKRKVRLKTRSRGKTMSSSWLVLCNMKHSSSIRGASSPALPTPWKRGSDLVVNHQPERGYCVTDLTSLPYFFIICRVMQRPWTGIDQR